MSSALQRVGDRMAVAVEHGAPRAVTDVGVYHDHAAANTDTPIAIPSGAVSVVLWFSTSAADATRVIGRVAFGGAAAITGVTATSTNMGFHPTEAVEYLIPDDVTHLHLAAGAIGNVTYGYFNFL